MKRSLKEVLADSHIAAIVIAVLLFWAVDSTFQALSPYVADAIEFVATAVAIFDIPYLSFTALNRFQLIISLAYLYAAVVEIVAASLISQWVYKSGPISALMDVRRTVTRDLNAEV